MSETAHSESVATPGVVCPRQGTAAGPTSYVQRVLANLAVTEANQYGLYVGDGSYANYLTLLDAGLKLHATGFSAPELEGLKGEFPETRNSTFAGDFTDYHGANIFAYIIADGGFQYDEKPVTNQRFATSSIALKQAGKLFARVYSVETEVVYPFDKISGGKRHGRVVHFTDGPEAGRTVRFFTKAQLGRLAAQHHFTVLQEPVEVAETAAGEQSPAVFWEVIWQKGTTPTNKKGKA